MPVTSLASFNAQLLADVEKGAALVQAACKDISTGVTTVQMIDPVVLDSLKAHNSKAVNTEALICAAAGQVPAASD